MSSRTVAGHIATGALAFAATQFLMFVRAGDAPITLDGSGWFLNSGVGVALVAGVLAGACAVLAVVTPKSRMWQVSGAFAAGAIAAMIVSLLVIGPGTLFPIVIAIGGGLIVIAALAGGAVGSSARSLVRRRPASRLP
jgi:hypothetical protein